MTHWYKPDGTMAYGASLKEAREMGYYISITSVEDVMYKYELENWKIKQAIMSALTLPREVTFRTLAIDNNNAIDITGVEYESDNDYIDRIIADSRQQAKKAAKLGTVIHHMAERYINKRPLFFKGMRPDVWVLFKPLQKWIDDNIESGEAEKVLVNNEFRYAGKADFAGVSKQGYEIIPDFKTTFIKPNDIKKDGNIKKAKIRDSWGRQLSALMACKSVDQYLSVIVSTNPAFPGVWVYKWGFNELFESYKIFLAALHLAQIQKGL